MHINIRVAMENSPDSLIFFFPKFLNFPPVLCTPEFTEQII